MKYFALCGKMSQMKSKRFILLLAVLLVCAIVAFFVPGAIIRSRLAAIDTVVTEQIKANNFPGAVVCVGRRNKVH